MWTVVPVTLQLPLAAKLTARVDDEVALTLKSGSPKFLATSAPKVIVWSRGGEGGGGWGVDRDGGTGQAAGAGRCEGDRQCGRCGRSHREVGIAEVLSSQCTKRDGLVRFGNRERLRHVRCRVVIAVTSLRSRDRATSPSFDMDCGTRHAALAAPS